MEKEINIAEILKNKPEGTKLFTPIHGEVTLMGVTDDNFIEIVTPRNDWDDFFYDGRYSTAGEPLLFPSNTMRDWSKFTWKKGDVLVSNGGYREVIFDGFEDDDYRTFKGKHWLDSMDENNIRYSYDITCKTLDYSLEEKDAAKCYINTIEERLGGKLNMETLEVEKPECAFKPFDRVLVRDEDDEEWKAALFSHLETDEEGAPYIAGCTYWYQCIPYNEQTAHLVGTTDKYQEL